MFDTENDRLRFKGFLDQSKGNEDVAVHEYLRWKGRTDLFFLGNHILGWKNSKDKTGKRKRVDPRFHRWLTKKLETDDDIMILVPRLHLKSTWVKLKIVQIILNDPYIRIGLFSATGKLILDMIKDIKRIFSTPIMLRLYPEIIPEPGKDFANWEKSTANTLSIYRPDKSLIKQGEQIVGLGSGATVTGMHTDINVLDDIIGPANVTTAEQMIKSEEWWAYIQSVLEIGGQTIIAGTHYHYNDIYMKIIREKHFRRSQIVKRTAIENGKVLYRTWFTKKDLAKIKKRQGNYIYSCQYMLNPIPKEDQIFPPPQPTFRRLPEGIYEYYIAVDPAATTKTYSDQTGICIAAKNHINQLFIVECLGVKADGEKIADILINKCLQYKPVKVGIEFGLQTHLDSILRTKKSTFEKVNQIKVPMNIDPIPISNKMSKASRINLTLGSFLREGRLLINENCRELIGEMDSFTGKGKEKDNMVDSAALLFSVISNYAYNYWRSLENLGGFDQTYADVFAAMHEGEGGYRWREEFCA